MLARTTASRALSLCLLVGVSACSGAQDGGDDPASGAGKAPEGAYFGAGSVWYRDASKLPRDPESAAVIAWLAAAGGFGTGSLRIDFSFEVLSAGPDAKPRTFEATGDFSDPDCDHAPIPIPPGGALEGQPGYACEDDGDCHLIVADPASKRLYEMWRADIRGDAFRGGCLAIWDMSRAYGPTGRGEQCTSADAAGYPIAPLLFSADEVAKGHIDHAIRFILPNPRIRSGVYVHPATHSTRSASGGPSAPPYGAHLRLRADYPVDTLPTEGARVVARALQRYGMFLADGGSIALTAQSDRFTKTKWDGLLGPGDLRAIQVTDFEMVEGGQRIKYTGDCVRAR